MTLFVGVNETDITPPLGVGLCGYAYRPHGATAVHDPLFAQATVFDDGDARLALLGMDLITLDFGIVERVRGEISHHLDIPISHVMLNATHTHAGPATRTYHAMPSPDPVYIEILARKLVGCARQAAGNLQPASLRFASEAVQVGINRRERVDGITRLGFNTGGPADPRVRCIAIADSRGNPFALLYSTACHPVTLGGDNLQISADFPGAARKKLRSELSDITTFSFLQGCCGNINPWRRGGFAETEANGELLAGAVLDAFFDAQPIQSVPISATEVMVDVPTIPPPPLPEVKARLAESEKELEDARQSKADDGKILYLEGARDFIAHLTSLAEKADLHPKCRFSIQSFKIGDLQIVGMPGEAFVQYGLDFERQSKGALLALGYTNGCHNYVPTAADYPLGGYEVEHAYRFYGELMFTPEAENILRKTIYRLLGIEKPDMTPYTV